MNSYEMVLGIVVVVMIASVLKSIFRGPGRRHEAGPDPETARLREEVQKLRDRVHVLERIATDKESRLEHEIEQLRDR